MQLTVPPVLLSALVRGMLDLDGDSSSRLVLLDHLLDLVVDFERSAANEASQRREYE